MCDPRDLNRRGASAAVGPRDHRRGHTPWSVPGGSTMHCSGEHTFICFYSFTTRLQTYVMKIHRHSPCLPPRKKTDGASSPFSGGGRTAGRVSDLKKRALDLMGKEEDRGSPFLISPSNPSASTATAPPQRQRGRCCEDAGENSLLKESFPPPGSEAYAVEATHKAGSRLPREPTLHSSLPARPSQKLSVSRS